MKNIRPANKIRRISGLFLVLLVITGTLTETAFAASGKMVTQNWSAAAVFYSSQSDETETFRMSEDEFLKYKVGLEERLIVAYSTYYNRLVDKEKEALQESQEAWIDCYYSYITSLEQLWLAPVKIYFGVPGQERRTNVYRDIILLLLVNRVTDLEEWNEQRFARIEGFFFADISNELVSAKKQLQIDMGLCLYVIQEEYRAKISDSHQKFNTFLDSNQRFVSLITTGDETIITAEELLQVQRMSSITQIHYQGCRFFRREREE